MATVDQQRQEAVNKLWEYVLGQGVMGFPFVSRDTTYLTDVGKLYEDYIKGGYDQGGYDSVTPRYVSRLEDPVVGPRAQQMINYMIQVGQGVSPDDIINLPDEQLNMTETEKDDLKRFASEQADRDVAMWEMAQSARLYGIPGPQENWDVPIEMVEATRAQKTGQTNAQAIKQEYDALNRVYNEMVADGRSRPVNTTNFGFTEDPAGWMWNQSVDLLQKAIGDSALAPQLRKIGVPIGGPAESTKVKRLAAPDVAKSPTGIRENSPKVGAMGKYLTSLEEMAAAEQGYDERLRQSIIADLESRLGVPYAAASKEAARIVASRKKGASGNYLL